MTFVNICFYYEMFMNEPSVFSLIKAAANAKIFSDLVRSQMTLIGLEALIEVNTVCQSRF